MMHRQNEYMRALETLVQLQAEALKKYGAHNHECVNSENPTEVRCVCGFDAARDLCTESLDCLHTLSGIPNWPPTPEMLAWLRSLINAIEADAVMRKVLARKGMR